VNVTFYYDDGDLVDPANENLMETWKHNGSWYKDGWGNWKSLDTASNVVSANITYFGSIFAPLQPIPLYPSQVQTLTPLGILLLVSIIAVGTIIMLKKKRK